jgi:hypothetical protein
MSYNHNHPHRRQSHSQSQQSRHYAPTNGTPDTHHQQQALQSSYSTPELTGYGSYPTPGGPVQQPSYADYVHPSQSYYAQSDQPHTQPAYIEYNPQAYANVNYNPAAYPPQPPPQSPRAPYSYAPSAASPPHSAGYHQTQYISRLFTRQFSLLSSSASAAFACLVAIECFAFHPIWKCSLPFERCDA